MTSAGKPEPNARATESRWLDWFEARNGLWSAIQAGALIVGGGWAVILLLISFHDRRVDLAMAQAAQFVEGRTSEARQLLDRLWYSSPAELIDLFREALAHLPNDDERGEAIHNFVSEYILSGDKQANPIDVQLAIADVAAQLDLIAVCAGEGGDRSWLATHLIPARCDRATAEEYFCGYADSFHTLYGGVLGDIRRTTGNQALGTASEKFARGPGCIE
ncbi:hypothetical protein [Roseovarius pacificus]|uniref:hypothetical protein n=1 Tax=Roseovarius pacificus TaxID=337701 RepID=UPI004039C50F